MRLQGVGQNIQPDHPHREAAIDGRFGHAIDHARLLALRDRHSSHRFDRAHTLRPVIAHAGHQHRNAFGAEFVGQALEQHIGRGTVTVDSGLVAQHRDIPQRQAFYLQVPASRADQHPSRQQDVSRLRFLDPDGADFIQTPGKHFGETFRHVLHHHNRAGKIRRQLRENVLQSLRPSGRDPDGNHLG